jgi:hypothetical protein
MSITYYNPDRPQQRQYEFIMQSLMNLAMQRTQLNFRKDEAETQRTWEEAKEKRQYRVAKTEQGFKLLAPSKKEYSAAPTGGTDVVEGGYGGVWQKPQMPTQEAPQGYQWARMPDGKIVPLQKKGWEPSTEEAAIRVAQAKRGPKAPTSRTRYEGNKVITEEYDLNTGKWNLVSTAPRKVEEVEKMKPSQVIDDIRAHTSSQRSALAMQAEKQGWTPEEYQRQMNLLNQRELADINRYRRTGKSAYHYGQSTDIYGFYPGEEIKDVKGNTWVYEGEDVWMMKGQYHRRSKRRHGKFQEQGVY